MIDILEHAKQGRAAAVAERDAAKARLEALERVIESYAIAIQHALDARAADPLGWEVAQQNRIELLPMPQCSAPNSLRPEPPNRPERPKARKR